MPFGNIWENRTSSNSLLGVLPRGCSNKITKYMTLFCSLKLGDHVLIVF